MVKRVKQALLSIGVAVGLLASVFMTNPVLAANVDEQSTEVEVSFQGGALELMSAPSFDFGEHMLSNSKEDYAANSITTSTMVSDARGSGSGWKLMVSLSPFQQNGEDKLQGAVLTLKNPTITAANGTVGTPPVAENEIVLTSDNASIEFLSATEGTGKGTWDAEYDKTYVELSLYPGTADTGAASATLNWSLEDTL